MLQWDDLRVFIAACQTGSFSGAAAKLGMDASTVGRRIRRLETSLRATLVARHRGGLQLTAAGQRLSDAGAGVEAAISIAAQEGAKSALSGTVRLSVAEGFALQILTPELPGFLERYPDLKVEIDASPSYLSPSTRKVDISITSNPPESERLTVEKLASYEIGLYASEEYLQKNGMPQDLEDLRNHALIGYVDDLIYTDKLRFIDNFVAHVSRRVSCSSIRMQVELSRMGMAIGAFPHFMVHDLPYMRRLLPEHVTVRQYWIATHRELYGTFRIRIVRQWLHALVDARRDILVKSDRHTQLDT